ncbi:MAG: virulence RhuM family protein [Candidatus Sumerlaeota bacterium]|nr:virulence RhuM family protein [Candidatus Sumerlaeota bacterium]
MVNHSDEKLPARSGPQSDLMLYQTEDGRTRLEVRLAGETVWLSLNQMAALFQRDKSVISKHIKNIFNEGELQPEATVANFATVQSEGEREVIRDVEYYNLDVVISVGYRVKSHRGVQFRIWATQRLREYIIKGFALDDDRLKQAGGGNYFEELLARIRDIRSSEKVFWRKALDIYATSIDYDPNTDYSHQFFATVQNKMHWAAHGHTAAEIIAARADASQPHMGLTSWYGVRPSKSDISVAKNYLNQAELEILNRIVSAYLDFAELQALNRRPMYMKDWIAKLDDFLRLGERDVLAHAGAVSHEAALAKANAEYERFRSLEDAKPSPVEMHFQEAIEQAKQLEKLPKKAKKPGKLKAK